MKNLLVVLLALVLCVSMAACTIDSRVKEVPSDTQTTQKESKEENYSLNETAAFKELKFTATEIEESNGTDFFEPEDGNVFVGVKFTIENISDEEQTVSSLLLFEGYVDDVKCDYSLSAACVFDEGTLDGSVAPGRKLVGWYALEVPEDWSVIELQVLSDWLSSNPATFVFEK